MKESCWVTAFSRCSNPVAKESKLRSAVGPLPLTPVWGCIWAFMQATSPAKATTFTGGAVNIAARIASLAGPGELLVSETVRSLARTSANVEFKDLGEHELKGVSEPQRIWAVAAR